MGRKGRMYSTNELEKIIFPIARKYGVERLFLFGSYARGDNTETSDIDFRIDKGRVQGLQMAALLLDLEDALQKPVDLISTGAMDRQFLERISKEEKLIYDGK